MFIGIQYGHGERRHADQQDVGKHDPGQFQGNDPFFGQSGSMQAAEIIASAREQIETLKETAEAEVDAQISEARKYIQKESETLAVNIMENLLERRLAS